MSSEINPVAQAASEAVAWVAPKAMTAGGLTGALGWLLSSEALGLAGVLVALCGLLLSRVDRRREHARKAAADERAKEVHRLVVARLQAGLPLPDLSLTKHQELDE